MPLAILLQEQLGILTKGVDEKLRHWDEATERFSLVVDRLRSAYLVHWFGSALPSVGLALEVGLVNMHELRARWLAIGAPAAGAAPPVGPNLLEPLLGAGGTLAGIFASPLNGILLTTAIGSVVHTWWAKTLAVVNFLSAGLLVGAGLAAGGPTLVLGLVPYAISGQPRELFDFLGAVAELAEPLQRFWQQVSGPRDAVRNPLLRELLILGDRMAALTAFLLGAFAVLITRIDVFLEPLRLGFVAVGSLVLYLWPVILLAFTQTVDVVVGLLHGPDSVPALLRRVLAVLAGGFRRIGTGLAATFALLRDDFRLYSTWGGWLVGWWSAVAEPAVRLQTVDHPTVRFLQSFAGSFGALSEWKARDAPAGPPSPPGTFTKVATWLLRKTGMPAATPKLPGLPPLPPLIPLGEIGPLVDVVGLLRRLGVGGLPGNPFEIGSAGRDVLQRAARPPSVFAGERAALDAEARRPQPLARTLEVATYLSLARRVVGPAAAESVRGLEDVLTRIDATIRAERKPLPVKDVPEPTGLTPVIRRLRIRSHGRTSEVLQTWADDLRRELNAADYAIPVGG